MPPVVSPGMPVARELLSDAMTPVELLAPVMPMERGVLCSSTPPQPHTYPTERSMSKGNNKRTPARGGAGSGKGGVASGKAAPSEQSVAAGARRAPGPSRPAPAGATARRRRRNINWIAIIAAVGGASLLAALIYNLSRELQVIPGVQTYGPFPANIHVAGDVNYPQTPPTGGEHRATWQNCGIYNDPVVEELAVHSMEHGAVWITYQPDLPADQVERLKGLVRGKSYTLLSPYPNLPAPVVASAWGVQLTVESADDARLDQFVAKYRNGSQTPEKGAACIGGQGTPDER